MIPRRSFLIPKVDRASTDNDEAEDLAPCWWRLLVRGSGHVERGPTAGGGVFPGGMFTEIIQKEALPSAGDLI